MKDTLKNISAVFRGNIIFGWNRMLRNCSYKNIVRVFKGADITVSKGGKFIVGKGVAIGTRSICTVRKGAVLKMGALANLNSDCKIVCHKKIEIGENTIVGPNVLVYDHDHLFSTESGVKRKEYVASEIIIGNNCWIGANTVILRGTHIGDNCLIGAGSVVKGDFPSGSKIIQKRTSVFGG